MIRIPKALAARTVNKLPADFISLRMHCSPWKFSLPFPLPNWCTSSNSSSTLWFRKTWAGALKIQPQEKTKKCTKHVPGLSNFVMSTATAAAEGGLVIYMVVNHSTAEPSWTSVPFYPPSSIPWNFKFLPWSTKEKHHQTHPFYIPPNPSLL